MKQGLELREDRVHGIYAQDLTQVLVSGVHDVLSLMMEVRTYKEQNGVFLTLER